MTQTKQKLTLNVHRWTGTVSQWFAFFIILLSSFEKRRKMFAFRSVGAEGREVSQVYTAEVVHQDGISADKSI